MAEEAEVPGGAGESGKRGPAFSPYSVAQVERWAVLQRAGDRRRRRNRILGWTVGGMLALGVAGWIAKPTLTERALKSAACDGALDDAAWGALAKDAPDRPLGEENARTDTRLGRYTCEVTDEEGERVVAVDAYTRRADVDAQLRRHFTELGEHPAAALPAGLPGFEDQMGAAVLMPPCPGPGKKAKGQPGQLLVNVHTREPDHERPLQVVAALANKAAEKLGCQGEPLPEPAIPVRPKTVRPSATAGTPCAALARGPLQGPRWTVDVRAPKGRGPMASCALLRSVPDMFGERKATVVKLQAWYGDWVSRMVLADTRRGGPRGESERGAWPWLTGDEGWATARCDGRSAAFRIYVRRGGGAGDPDESVDNRTLTTREMRRTLAAFAKDQGARQGCRDLRLPPGQSTGDSAGKSPGMGSGEGPGKGSGEG